MKASTTRRVALGAIFTAPLAPVSADAGLGREPPSDLARACFWAIQRRAWIDAGTYGAECSDELADAELDRVDAVFARAIAEPSLSLQDLAAKAALALEDFERFTARPGGDHSDGVCIVQTVLREVVSMLGDAAC